MGKELTVKEVLQHAKEILETNEWHQGSLCKYADGQPYSFCMLGALSKVKIAINTSTDDFSTCSTRRAATDIIFSIIAGPLALWNDASGRTKEEVLRVFDQAIARAQ